MKKILLIFTLLCVSHFINAADYSKQLCNAITQHKYAKALKMAEKMDSIPRDAFVLISDLQEFIEYAMDKSLTLGTYYNLLRWYASECHDMGDLCSLSKETYSDAEYWYKEGIDVYKVIDGDTSIHHIEAIQQLFEMYSTNDSIDKAIEQLEILFNIYAVRNDTIKMCTSLQTYGFLMYRKGENQHSDGLFHACDSLVSTISSNETRNYLDITLKEQRALLYFTYRDYDRALPAYENLKLQFYEYYGENKVVNAIYDTYIGIILAAQKDSDTAESKLKTAADILYDYKESNEQLKTYFTMSAFTHAHILFTKQRFIEAENILTHLTNFIEFGTHSETDPIYLGALSDLAMINWIKRDCERAEKYINECVETNELMAFFAGDQYYPYVNSVFQKSVIQRSCGRFVNAYETTLKSYGLHKALVQKNLSFLSSDQRDEYWNTIQFRFTDAYPGAFYQLSGVSDTISGPMYNNALFYKSILLKTTTDIQNAILQSKDTVLISAWNELQEIESILLIDNTSSSLVKRRNDLDKLLTNRSIQYKKGKENVDISWRDIMANLSSGEISIEFSSFRLFRERYTDSTMYCALLLRNNSKYPEMIPLFEEKEVLSLVNTSSENQTSFTYSSDGNGEQLSNLVWSKILPHIKPGETIYFAPSGLLHQVAIEALPYDESHTMADMFNLVRLSSTREIVLNKSSEIHTTATLYGGIQYNMDTTEIKAESELYPEIRLSMNRSLNDTTTRKAVDYLRGTKKEVEQINEMLKDNNLQVKLFTSTSANEESFKALSGKHQNILHIATHGFYWSDSTAQKKDYFSQRMLMMDDKMPTQPTIDPLNRCGLLFAGANTAYTGHRADLPEGVQDGILTAKEISLLDLRDADLVVLSACETGKGEITGEGVFGLQRAFKQAGAQTIIMSLWPVNDDATQFLMTEFYRNWIANHQSKREAFRNAQNKVRSQMEAPYYWAGFIMLD